MKKFILAIAAVAMILATSCKKEAINEPEVVREPEANEFCAEIDNGAAPQNMPSVNGGMTTKTYFDQNSVRWNSQDKIYVNGTEFLCDTTPSQSGTRAYFKRNDGQTGAFTSDTGYHAFFGPISAYNGATGTLSGNLAWQKGHESNVLPMYAHSNNHWLTFKNICGVLKIEVPYDNVKKIVIKTQQINHGSFRVNSVPTDTFKLVITNTTAEDTAITLSGSFSIGDYAYIPMPAGTYNNLEVIFLNSSDGIIRQTGKKSNTITIAVNKIYNVKVPTDFLPGLFTVSSTGKKVKFAKGNLWYNRNTAKAYLESTQIAYPTESSWDNNHVCYFSFKTDIAGASNSSTSAGTEATSAPFFATNVQIEGVSFTVLSENEWTYILGRKDVNGQPLHKHKVNVDGTYCIVIKPDGCTGTPNASYTLNEIESLGYLCLPYAGCRYDNTFKFKNEEAWYWTSSLDTKQGKESNALLLYGIATQCEIGTARRYTYCSIRPVIVVSQGQ